MALAVQIIQRWFYARVRHRTFTSLVELSASLREHLEIFNLKKHRVFGRSRAEMFEAEKEHLLPLPEREFTASVHRVAKVHPDCHVVFENNYDSVPHTLRGLDVDVWATDSAIEISHQGARVAFHARRLGHGQFSTDKKHYPEAARAYAETSVQQVMSLAKNIGPETEALVAVLLNSETPLRQTERR